MSLGDDPALRRLDVFPYVRRVGELMSAPLISIEQERTLSEAAGLLSRHGISSLVTVGAEGRPSGILTERDLIVAIAAQGAEALNGQVSRVLSTPVATVRESDLAYVAIGRLERLGLRHLVVVDDKERAVGMVTARSLLRQRAAKALVIGDEIEAAGDGGELAAARRRLPGLAARMRAEAIPALDVAGVLSAMLRDLTRRVTELSASAMAREVWGDAPAPWAMLVLGSGGRGESLLVPDQDNALVHLGAEADDRWFAELGRRTADLLDQAGIPYCRGGVMAREQPWRHTLAGWKGVIRHWTASASPSDVLNADIFFDFVGVAGSADLAEELRSLAVAEIKASPMLVQHLAMDLARSRAPVGWLGGIRTEAGRVDLKLAGLLPIVGIARALALKHGIRESSTANRLQQLERGGWITDLDRDQLGSAHEFLAGLVIEQQEVDISADRPAGSKVEVSRLTRPQLRQLKHILRDIEKFAQATASGLT